MAEVHHLDFFKSDHRLISISVKSGCETIFKKRPKRFMFEHKWMLEEDFKEIMQQWLPSNNQVDLPRKLTMFSKFLQKWAGSRFSHLSRQIESLCTELARLLNPDNAVDNAGRIAELQGNIEKLTCQEEMHWKQKARTNWLAHGDGNTKFFHSYASERKRINYINGIFYDCGIWCTKNEEMAEIFLKYYANIFNSSNPTTHDVEEAIINIWSIVDDNMNSILCAPYTAMEVKKALFDMHPSKAPGNDEFTALFFQKNWDIVGDEVTAAILRVLNEQGDLSDWNSTVIVLIPKVLETSTPKDYRPISLCNTCYKIVSRTITNRLRPILSIVIDQFQSAFVPGCLITDNVIIGFECMHWIRNNRKANKGFGALKLDMSKAYDRVEWRYLEAIMLKLGFAESFLRLVLKCISTVSYSFRVNHNTYGKLIPKRGIRQGDLLSPYLFALCAQGLSAILSRAVWEKLFKGVKISHNCQEISHLLFAGNSLIFFRAMETECIQLRRCLQIYERVSGQTVNYDKSGLTFSPSVSLATINAIQTILSIPVVQGHELYLGLPTFSLRSKRIQLSNLRERLIKKINGWASSFFSVGGKETLIKSILQAIPSYAMSCFKLPISLCNELEQLCAKFWWNKQTDGKGMHWASWRKLCRPK